MATVQQEEIQVHVKFITDESRKLAGVINSTKEYNQLITQSRAQIEQYNKRLQAENITEEQRLELLEKIAAAEKVLATNLKKVADEGKRVQGLDLTKVAPAQLRDRARQIALAMSNIADQSLPEFKELETELGRVNTRLTELKQSAKGITPIINQPATGGGILGTLSGFLTGGVRALPVIGQIVAGFTALKGALTGAADLEQLNISFETFLGNAEKAKQVVLDLRKFADVTPFETEEVNKAGRALLAFGTPARELIPTLTQIGDIAAGTGKDFAELATIFGKARAEGLIQNDTLNQLAEAGIPIYGELAKVLDVNESQIRKLAEQGKIQFKDLQQAFANLSGEGGRFGGLMEKQSQSIAGLWSTLKSGFNNFMTDFGNVLAPLVKAGLQLLVAGMENLGKVAKPVFELFQWGFQAIINVSKQATGWVADHLPGAIRRFVRSSEELPYVGKAITALLTPLRLLIDAFESLPATAAGVVAALTDIFTTGGANAGRAYGEARRKVLEEERQEEARARAEAARDDRQLSAKEQAELAEQERKAAAERAAAREKEQEEAKKRAEAAFKAALAQVEVGVKRQELLLENARIKHEITEAQYQNRLLDIQESGLKRRLDVFKQFHRLEEVEALEAQNKLEQLERKRVSRFLPAKDTTAQPGLGEKTGLEVGPSTEEIIRIGSLADLPDREQNAQDALRDKFTQALTTEQDYELKRLELKKAFLEEELALLRAATEPQVAEITEREREKRDIEFQIGKQRLENDQRLEALRQEAMQQGSQAIADVFSLGAELLSQDEKSKKKHASAIKAFQVAQVQTSLFAEIAGIYENAQKSPIAKLLGPVAGNLLAAGQAILATVRAGIAIGKINSVKFAGGGYTGPGFGIAPDSTGHRPVGVVHNNEWVSPEWMTKHPVWGAQIAALDAVRQRGFADGGYATTPTVNIVPAAAAGSAAAAGVEGLQMMTEEFRAFRQEIRDWQGRVHVVYTDVESTGAELTRVRVDAAI